MTLRWRAILDSDSTASPADLSAAGLDEVFDDRDSAEAWLGEYFSDLSDLGVASVELLDGEDVVYRMSLEA